MATQVQFRRGTTAQHAGFAGADGELTLDSDKETVVVHDGATAGGFPLLRNVVEDLTPELGGDLNLSTFSLLDVNANTILDFEVGGASAVNNLVIFNADAASEPGIKTVGTDTDIDLLLEGKGTGVIKANGTEVVKVSDNVSLLTNDANYQGQVVPGTVGDFAALDASGNIIDGGAQASDFATATQGTTADSAVQPVVPGTVNDFAALDASGYIIDGGAQASDFATAAQGTTADAAAPLASPTFTGVPALPTYTIGGGLPAVGSGGGMIYVSDATGSGVTGSMCFSNGASWIDVTTGIAVA